MSSYSIFIPEGGLGKIIASTAVAENIKLAHPDRELIVVTPWPEVFLNNPHVSRLYRTGNTPYFYRDYILNKDSLIFKGEPYFITNHIHQRKHVIENWCELFQIPCKTMQPQLYFNARELQSVVVKYNNTSKPMCVFQTSGGVYNHSKPYCWTRDFPVSQAQAVADALSKDFTVVQVTRTNGYKLKNVEILGDLPKRELMAMLLISKKRVLIDSCMQHAAAALNLPSTVCWVGTSPNTFGYTLHKNVMPNIPKDMDHLIDSYLFDYNFEGVEHEYPYSTNQLFNLAEVIE